MRIILALLYDILLALAGSDGDKKVAKEVEREEMRGPPFRVK
jgi:hypothetical protein